MKFEVAIFGIVTGLKKLWTEENFQSFERNSLQLDKRAMWRTPVDKFNSDKDSELALSS